jgi:p-aminobenzoyl-glutamate transporter AbgT
MVRHRWNETSSNDRGDQQRTVAALVLALLTVSWLPLSVQAWSAAWSGLHPVSVNQLVRLTIEPVMRQGQISSPTPSK